MICRMISLFIIIPTLLLAKVAQNDELVQISTIDALLGGIYDGEINLAKLLQYGNFGLGTFNSLDGEMIVLEGVCYQIKSDGNVVIPNVSIKTPFAAVTSFEPDIKMLFKGTINMEQLQNKIDSLIPSINYLYALKICGRFITAKARSVPAQKSPFKPLIEITKNQPVFSFENIGGTLVGFRCPAYIKGLNVAGFHLHLLTEKRNAGGHLLSMIADSLIIEIDQTDSYRVLLPHDKFFSEADFSSDKEGELKKAEK